MLHLFVRQFTEASEDQQQIGLLKGGCRRPQSRNVLRGRIDKARIAIHGEEHRRAATVMRGEDAAQLRDQFLAAVLVVAGDEHDMLSRQRTLFALQDDTVPVGEGQGDSEQQVIGSSAAAGSRQSVVLNIRDLGLWNER